MFPGGKGGRCLGLTTLPPSCADCLEIWEPQPPGTLRACPGLYWGCFTFTVTFTYNVTLLRIHVTSVVVETQLCVPVVWLLMLHVAVTSTKQLNDAMEKQDSVPFARFSNYEISNSYCCEQ